MDSRPKQSYHQSSNRLARIFNIHFIPRQEKSPNCSGKLSHSSLNCINELKLGLGRLPRQSFWLPSHVA